MQISWFLDYAPGFSQVLMLLGAFLLYAGRLRMDKEWSDIVNIPKLVYSLSLILLFYPVFVRFEFLSVIFLLGMAKFIEGASLVAFYQKVRYSMKNKKIVGSKSLSGRILVKLSILFIIVMSGWVFLIGVALGTFQSPFDGFRIIWTIGTIIISILGMSWKLWGIVDNVPTESIVGFALLSAGVEVFNTGIINEILFLIVGSAIYSVGFWVSVWLVLYSEMELSQLSMENIGNRYDIFRTL